MTLVRQNPSGWALRDRITASQINGIDAQMPKALDAVSGGAYTPSGPIQIGGSGLSLVGQLGYTSRTIVRLMPPVIWTNDTGRWTQQSNDGSNNWKNTTSVGGGSTFLYWGLDAPHGATLNQVRMRFRNPTASTQPTANPPAIQLGYHEDASDTDVLIGTPGADVWTNLAAYQANHWITQTGIGHVVDRTTRSYFATFRGEFGSGSQVGDIVSMCEITAVFTAQSEWM